MDKIYDYIVEQPVVLKKILNESEEMTKSFVSIFKNGNVKKIIMCGSGSSYNAACSAKYFMEKLLKVEVEVPFAHEFFLHENIIDKDALIVGISQSGESTAAVNCVKKAKKLGLATIAVTSEDGSYITEDADHKMIVASGEEKGACTTKGYTATVLAFYLAAVETAYSLNKIDKSEYDGYKKNIETLIDGLDGIITETNKWYDKNKASMISIKNMIVSGYGNNFGTTLEAGLKFMETSRFSTSVYELEEFMHGPYNSIDRDSFIFFIVSEGEDKERAMRLDSYFSKKTDNSYMIMKRDSKNNDDKNVCVNFFEDSDLIPLEYIVPVQVLFYRLAKDRGVDLSSPRYPDLHLFMKSRRKVDF